MSDSVHYEGGAAMPDMGQRARVVIFTAIALEFRAVRAHLSEPRPDASISEAACEYGIFSANGRVWDVWIVEAGLGTVQAATMTAQIMPQIKPQIAFFIGVAGGLKDVSLGDVVVATQIYDCEFGKVDPKFLARPRMQFASHAILQSARHTSRQEAWWARAQALSMESHEAVESTAIVRPQVLLAPLASLNQVVTSTDAEIVERIHQYYNDVVAVEMEGYGFLKALPPSQTIEGLVIRGISDRINDKALTNRQQTQERAARHASAFAFEVLANIASNAPVDVQATRVDVGASTSTETSGPELTTDWQSFITVVQQIDVALADRRGLSFSESDEYTHRLNSLQQTAQRALQHLQQTTRPTQAIERKAELGVLRDQAKQLRELLPPLRRVSRFREVASDAVLEGDQAYVQAQETCQTLLQTLKRIGH